MKNKRKNKRRIAKVLASFMIFNFIFTGTGKAYDKKNTNIITIDNKKISKGITYKENQISYYEDKSNKKIKNRINVVKAELNNENVGIVFSKGKEKALGMESLSSQINNEINKGNNVVAGINADFFNMTIGVSVGPQIKDESIIVGYTSKSDENRYPILGIDKNNKAFIENLHFEGTLTVLSEPKKEEKPFNPLEGSENNEKTSGEGNTNAGDFLNDIIDEAEKKEENTEPISTEKSIAVDSINRYDEFEVNRFRMRNQLMVLTSIYNESGIIKGSKYAPNNSFVIITGVKEDGKDFSGNALKLGRTYEGVVEKVGQDLNHLTIPKNGIVIMSTDNKGKWVKDNVTKGAKVKISANFDKKDILNAVSGYNYLVKDGEIVTKEDMSAAGVQSYLIKGKKPRSAIGLTKNNELIAITVEGGQVASEVSDGATLPEMAEIMRNLGVVTAMNLDGGGSTQMNVKAYAENNNKLVNKPTDGGERSVTNGILFVNKAPKSSEIGSMKIDGSAVIYKNSSYNFKVKGEDKNYYPFDFKNKNIKWSVDKSLGKIDAKGNFTAGDNMAIGIVQAELDGVKARTYVVVVNKISDFGIKNNGPLYLNYNDTHQLQFYAKTNIGQDIVLDKKNIKWSVKGNVGTIDKNGLLKITSKKGSGEVIAEAGGKKAVVKVEIGKESRIIEDFENENGDVYNVKGYVGGIGEISQEQAWNGNQSYKVTYDYDSKWTRRYNGTINLIPTSDADRYISYTRPKKLGLRVYGDGKAPWLRAKFTDAKGEEFTLNLKDRIDWNGEWQNVYGDIPEDAALPIKLEFIYMVETNKELHHKGQVYFDDLRYIYTENEDLKREELTTIIESEFPKQGDVITADQSIITANIKDATSEIAADSIKVTIDGRELTAIYDELSGKIYAYPNFKLKNGKHKLIINAKNEKGKPARRMQCDFTVKVP